MTHVIYKLYSPVCDFPLTNSEPCIDYMLATLPRSGSTFFATELWRTGVLGAPMEYLNPYYIKFLVHRKDYNESGIHGYWRWVKQHRTSPNGVFGYKTFAVNYLRVSARAPSWLLDIAPRKVVLLLRTSVLEQAVSYSKAMRSKIWFSDTNVPQRGAYDAGHIGACIELIHGQLEFWSRLFDLTGAKVCPVSYEEALTDLDGVVSRVASFLGVQLRPGRKMGPPLLHVQRTNQSSEWMQRYLDEQGDAGKDAIEEAAVAVNALLARE